MKTHKWPSYSKQEIEAVVNVLSSGRVNYWTGDQCKLFEQEFAAFIGVNHAICLMNGSVALEAALVALDIRHDDEVIVTSRSFLASATSILRVGARPVFVDVCATSGNISPPAIEAAITEKTRAIICVHLGGWPCDMDAIMAAASERSIFVIEDCAQAHGAVYKNRNVGSIGHFGVFSFCQDKILTSGGEGGAITCNDSALAEKVWSFKDHGKNRIKCADSNGFGFQWVHDQLGTNLRMTEMQAAILRIQLRNLASTQQFRALNASMLVDALVPFTKEPELIRVPEFSCGSCTRDKIQCGCVHAFYRLTVYLVTENLPLGINRDLVVRSLNDLGVPCNQGSCPEIYLEKVFVDRGLCPIKRKKIAKNLGETSITFLVDPSFSRSQMGQICRQISIFFSDLASKFLE